MAKRALILVPLFLLAQALFVRWSAGNERLPAAPDLNAFPKQIGGWGYLQEDPVPRAAVENMRSDRLLSRFYMHQRDKRLAALLVAWYQSQRGGERQPHSPKVCLPGSGWVPSLNGRIDLATPAGTINVNRMVAGNNFQRSAILYWYQTPSGALASEWSAKFWLVAGALKDHRTDTALVRVVVPVIGKQDQAALDTAAEFARTVYPVLLDRLPR